MELTQSLNVFDAVEESLPAPLIVPQDAISCSTFSGVRYLGAATISTPNSETEIQRNIRILNDGNNKDGIEISLSIPSVAHGSIIFYDTSDSVISLFDIQKVLFYSQGIEESQDAGCFAFTYLHLDSSQVEIFQCHAFRCETIDAVPRVSMCFSKLFHYFSGAATDNVAALRQSTTDDLDDNRISMEIAETFMFVFEVNLEIKEINSKGNLSTVHKDANAGFRLHANSVKQLHLTIKQLTDIGGGDQSVPLSCIERCFGVLAAAGRHVRHSDMQLLEKNETGLFSSQPTDRNCTHLCAILDPNEPSFEPINKPTATNSIQFLSVAVDLVLKGIQEPVRFLIETRVHVVAAALLHDHRPFWSFRKKPTFVQQFYLNVKPIAITTDSNSASLDKRYQVLSMESSEELDTNLLSLNFANLVQTSSTDTSSSPTCENDTDNDNDEPLLSGTGSVSKDCPQDVLESWAKVLNMPTGNVQQRPKQLTHLVQSGIPQALRGEFWQRLVNIDENGADAALLNKYRCLITQKCNCESVIQRDISRTFPAHDFFKDVGGLGQDSLHRVIKAYAVYDQEVGYCQGLTFLAATMLLHVPEEQAFCILTKLMYDYELRNLYKNGFDHLYLRLYQLNRLLEKELPALWTHFNLHKIETHMFASQWFLTIFTARFPLPFVFQIIDIILLQGVDTIIQVALALLMFCKRELLTLDFEGVLKYFRVTLPRKCRNSDAIKTILKYACSIRLRKLSKYEAEFNALKDGWEVINSDSETINNASNDKITAAAKQEECHQDGTVMSTNSSKALEDEDRILLIDEIHQLKCMLKREINQAEHNQKSSQLIISEYKTIVQQLQQHLQGVNEDFAKLKEVVSKCKDCSELSLNQQETEAQPNNDQKLTNPLNIDNEQKIKELELQLAEVKLARVEADCRNQDLIHQLHIIEVELMTNSKQRTWPPWLTKTFASIKEAAIKKNKNFTVPGEMIVLRTSADVQSSLATADNSQLPITDKNSLPALFKLVTSAGRPDKLKDSQSCDALSMQ